MRHKWAGTYHYHCQQDETSGCGLSCAAAGVEQQVNAGGDGDDSGCEEAGHGHVVGMDRVAANNDEDSDDEHEVVDASPPGVRREDLIVVLYLSDETADEGDAPGKLDES